MARRVYIIIILASVFFLLISADKNYGAPQPPFMVSECTSASLLAKLCAAECVMSQNTQEINFSYGYSTHNVGKPASLSPTFTPSFFKIGLTTIHKRTAGNTFFPCKCMRYYKQS